MVFDLSRISAESMTHSMAEIAAAVSQEVTGAEERVALDRSGPVQPVVGAGRCPGRGSRGLRCLGWYVGLSVSDLSKVMAHSLSPWVELASSDMVIL